MLTRRAGGGILRCVILEFAATSMFAFFQLGRRSPASLAPASAPGIGRRRFLALGAVMAASIATSACEAGADPRALGQPGLLAALGPDVVRRLGRRYRQSVPGESDARRLAGAIRASQPWPTRLGLRHRPIDEQIRDDFDARRTVVVDGWLLSVTEARQCALYSALAA